MKRFYSAIIMIPEVACSPVFRGEIRCGSETKQLRFGVLLTCERTFLARLEVIGPDRNMRRLGTRFIRPPGGQEESFTHTFSFVRPEERGYPVEFILGIEVRPDVPTVPAYLTLSAESAPDQWVDFTFGIPEGSTWTLEQEKTWADNLAKAETIKAERLQKAQAVTEPERRIIADEPNDMET